MHMQTKQTAIQQGLLAFTLIIGLGLFLIPPLPPETESPVQSASVERPAAVQTESRRP